MVEGLAGLAKDSATQFAAWIDQARKSATCTLLRLDAEPDHQPGALVRDFGSIFLSMVKAVGPMGDDLIKTIVALVDQFATFAASAEGQKQIREFFQNFQPMIQALTKIFVEAAKAAPSILNVLRELVTCCFR